ncbi:major vault protein-like [Oscarella lobularis]|uniref:major vault protein-like n=1 Tax=Oscarella lobularis TaxID=121494 RepID=UPI0033130D90
MASVIGLKPLEYVHILDVNTSVSYVETGPQTISLQDNERLTAGPHPFVVVPPGRFCIVEDPIDATTYEKGKQPRVRFGSLDVRFHGEPFFLYPGERLQGAPNLANYKPALKPLPVIKPNHGLRLRARHDHVDENGTKHVAGEEWHLEGPLTYKPTPDAEIVDTISPAIVGPNQALRFRARERFVDRTGAERVTGEEWLVREAGAYVPHVSEEVVGVESAHTLTRDRALHVRARVTIDGDSALGSARKTGEEWPVTCENVSTFIPDVTEEVVKVVNKTILTNIQYCVVVNPVIDGKNRLSQRQLRRGPAEFFLSPGEHLERGIQSAFILAVDEALVLRATEAFVDDETHRAPGDRWMIEGPTSYVPPTQVVVERQSKAIPLGENEGVYVQDTQTGAVIAVMGPQSYLLKEHEQLFEKKLPDDVEEMLRRGGAIGDDDIRKVAYFESSIDPSLVRSGARDATRVVSYRCPGNAAVQVYDYQRRTARVVFGPDMVILGPHEDFNVLSLSAGKPKRENALRCLALMLGPDFITDIIVVETADHARLRIKLAFNNYFDVNCDDVADAAKIFAVPDFIGFACRDVGSRIRSAVAQTPFDEFHRHSSRIIRASVFGLDARGKVKNELRFAANNLVVTNIDVQSIEPVDRQMSDSLSKSVQMAIEIATQAIERQASQEARRREQEARGVLEREKLKGEMDAERARMELYELQAISAAVESTGQAQAEAQAQAERLLIEGESAIESTKLFAEAQDVEHSALLDAKKRSNEGELGYVRATNELELAKAKALAGIEVGKFRSMVSALGSETVAAIARAGPESDMRLLKSLGLQSTLLTDGKSPVNLFNVAGGLVGATMATSGDAQ